MTTNAPLEAARVSDLFAHIMTRVLSGRVVAEVSRDEVSTPQMHALRYLWLHREVLMGDLAEGLGITYPSATNMVKRLERRGLVRRIINPADRREVEVRLTESGARLVEAVEAERLERLQKTLDAMPEAEREALLEGLRSFVETAVRVLGDIRADICLKCGLRASPQCPVCAVAGSHQDRDTAA